MGISAQARLAPHPLWGCAQCAVELILQYCALTTLFIPLTHGTAAPALDIALLCGLWHPRIPGSPLASLFPCHATSLGGSSGLIPAAFWACSVFVAIPQGFSPRLGKKLPEHEELTAAGARKVWDARLGIWVSLMLCQAQAVPAVGWMLSLQDGPRPPPRLRSGCGRRGLCRGRRGVGAIPALPRRAPAGRGLGTSRGLNCFCGVVAVFQGAQGLPCWFPKALCAWKAQETWCGWD